MPRRSGTDSKRSSPASSRTHLFAQRLWCCRTRAAPPPSDRVGRTRIGAGGGRGRALGAPSSHSHASTSKPPRSRSAWWTDLGVGAFALFTLVAHATVALGGSLIALGLGALAVLGLLLGIGWRLRPDPGEAGPPIALGSSWRDPLPPFETLVLVGLAAAGAGATWATGSMLPAWLTIAGLGVWRGLRPDATPRPTGVASAPGLIPALALVCAITVAVSHRANEDDAFYLNMAVAAADAPGAALLAGDTLHGYDDVPMDLPVFRLHAFEPAIGLFAWITGIEALVLAHVALPPLFAALIPLVWARLLRRLAPGEWPWLLVGLVTSLYLFSQAASSFGDFALLRLQQGKAIVLVVLWPLLADAGLAFGAQPSVGRWLRLAATQVAALGLTTNALWLAPVLGGLGVVTGCLERFTTEPEQARARPSPRDTLRTLALGALASSYPVGVALAMRAEMVRAFSEATHPMPGLSATAAELMADALERVAGTGLGAAWLVFAVAAATALAPTAPLRRFIAVYAAAATVLFWSPLHAHLIATGITGPDTYFRVLWIWPVPLAFAALLTWGVGLATRIGRSGLAAQGAAFALSVAIGLGLSEGVVTPSPANGVRLGVPDIKIDPAELSVARAVARHAGSGDFVLAPVGPSHWVGLLHDHPHPLLVRDLLLDVLAERFAARELTLRAQLTRMVGGDVRLPRSGELLAEAIASVPLQAVVLQGEARQYRDVERALEASPLERVEETPEYEVWARPAG